MSVSVSIDDSNSGGVLLYYDPLLLEDPSADGVRTDVYIVLTTGHSKIVAPENSYRLFAFENLSQINFNGMLDTSQVGNMDSMFYSCSVTSLDLSGFNTANVYNMMEMFAGCRNLTNSLDGDGLQAMFSGCTGLQTIYVDPELWVVQDGVLGTDMFKDCTILVGGSGTVYSADYVDSTYARIDGGVEATGYLTAAQGEPNGG